MWFMILWRIKLSWSMGAHLKKAAALIVVVVVATEIRQHIAVMSVIKITCAVAVVGNSVVGGAN